MHGRRKVLTTEEQQVIKKKERQKKLVLFETARDRILEKRCNKEYDEEALSLTAKMLVLNPDIVSFWNYRREVIESAASATKSGDSDLKGSLVADDTFFRKELELTDGCLLENPKSYSAWQHRAWILTKMQQPDFKQELEHCAKALQMDERNFHCWDYRRFVCDLAKVSPELELKFSDEKIQENFSNYSAWHYRSSLLPRLFPDPKHRFVVDEVKLKEEFELVQNAFFTDPEDSSAWFYHYWLLQQKQDGGTCCFRITKLVLDLRNCVASVVLNASVNLAKLIPVITIRSGEYSLILSNFSTPDSSRCSPVWRSLFKPGDLGFLASSATGSISITFECSEMSISAEPVNSRCISVDVICLYFGLSKDTNDVHAEAIRLLLKEGLVSCQQLLEMEPDNKWPLVNIVVTMHALDPKFYEQEIQAQLAKLTSVDKKRRHYYEDMVAKFRIEGHLSALRYQILDSCSTDQSTTFVPSLDLSGLQLTRLQLTIGLVDILELNISNNAIVSISPLKHLLNLRVLKADNNRICSLRHLASLQLLQVISVCGNCISNISEVEPLNQLRYLKELNVEGNPLSAISIYEVFDHLKKQ